MKTKRFKLEFKNLKHSPVSPSAVMDSFIIFHMKGEDIYKKIFSNPSTNFLKKILRYPSKPDTES